MAIFLTVLSLFLGSHLLLAAALPAESLLTAGCTATSYSEIASIVASCPTSIIQGVTVPAGGQIVLNGLHGKTVQFSGKISFQSSSSGRDPGQPLIKFSSSSNTKLVGLPGHEINGNGPDYWDGGGGNKGIKKPKFMRIEKVTDSTISNLHVINTPVHSFAISGCEKVTLDGIRLDNSAGDKPCSGRRTQVDGGGGTKSCGHNTDGFGVSGSHGITIKNSVVYNQDDCLAVNSGSDIHFLNNYCSGGHGISIGSIKSGAKVSGVHVSNSTIRASENGVRIKTYNDATDASVSDVHYKDITLEGITKFGIIIQQDYRNDGPTGTAGNSVPIKQVTLQGVHGTMKSGQGVYVNCGRGTCSGWTWSDINVTGGRVVKAPPSGCIQAPASAAAFCKG